MTAVARTEPALLVARRRGIRARGVRPVWLALVLSLVTCSGEDTPPAVTQCAKQLDYWTREALRQADDTGVDYQGMGLTAEQYDALRALVDQARKRPEQPSDDWVRKRATAACRRLPRIPSSGPGWP